MWSAPQQTSCESTSTSQPFCVRTFTVASLTSAKSWSARQPVKSATRFFFVPLGALNERKPLTRSNSCLCRPRNELERHAGRLRGHRAQLARQPALPSEEPSDRGEAQDLLHPESLKITCWSFRLGSSFRNRNQRRNLTIRPWLRVGSSSVRVFSRIEPYSTPEGHGRLARAAVEALVEVAHHLLGRLDPLVEDPLHEVDAAPGGIHLDAELAVGRAGLQAEPAVDARGDLLEGRRVVVLFDLHRVTLPGFSCFFGSRIARRFFMIGDSPGPHGSLSRFSMSSGADSATR
jgi:hypothetical protein